MTDVLQLERSGATMIATLNRPAKGNALNQELITALDELAARLEDPDSDARALVLTGSGAKAFSAGADITELDGISAAAARDQMIRGQAVFDRLERLPVVVVAAVNGFALGGGLELAMAADIRVASATARFGQPEITLANVPGWGGTQRLPRLVGRSLATELILTGDLIDTERALAIGLITHVNDEPLTFAVELANRIGARSRTAVRGAKHAIRIGLEEGPRAGLSVEADAVAACCETDEQRVAVTDFLQRRRPAPRTG